MILTVFTKTTVGANLKFALLCGQIRTTISLVAFENCSLCDDYCPFIDCDATTDDGGVFRKDDCANLDGTFLAYQAPSRRAGIRFR